MVPVVHTILPGWSAADCGTDYHGLADATFEDIEHGSELQMSRTFMLNLHEAILLEKRVADELYLGADNAAKENKNNYGCWWCMWMMCISLYPTMQVRATGVKSSAKDRRSEAELVGRFGFDVGVLVGFLTLTWPDGPSGR